MSTEAVLAEIGNGWHVVRPLDGGWQGGASLVANGERQGVLKWSDRAWWAPRVLAAKPLVDHARRIGYPTPEWFEVGTTRDGFPFAIQEYVEGDCLRLDDLGVDALIALTALQRTIRFEQAVNWNEWMHATVFDDSEGYQGAVSQSSAEGAEVVGRAAELALPHRDAPLIATEMVHGDLSADNVLVRDGRIVAVIDIEALGTGCATFDLLTPSRQDYIWGNGAYGDRLIDEALRRDGRAGVAIAAACHAINILAFGIDHWPADDVRGAAVATLRWLDAVRGALG